jgi:hypothetical protein
MADEFASYQDKFNDYMWTLKKAPTESQTMIIFKN